jgi:hypothetical protein
MVLKKGRWVPARRLSLPHHHSYRLELSNWRAFSKLRKRKGKHRVILEITKVTIKKVPGQRRWFATYRARVLRVR